MNKIVFATNNPNKLAEVRALMPQWEILSLSDINCHEEIPETEITLQGNARLKADYVTNTYGYDCFADDTGLEVPALNGAPGVYSARYAGESANAENNMNKLLSELQDKENRSAQFRTVVALNLKGKSYFFEGVCKGEILKEKHGKSGFGYDPVFVPEGLHISFAQMSKTAKGHISHRGKAIRKLITFLNNKKQ